MSGQEVTRLEEYETRVQPEHRRGTTPSYSYTVTIHMYSTSVSHICLPFPGGNITAAAQADSGFMQLPGKAGEKKKNRTEHK